MTVRVTDATFELIRSYYVAFEDGTDDVTPVIKRAMRHLDEDGRALPAPERPELEPTSPDHLADIADAMRGPAAPAPTNSSQPGRRTFRFHADNPSSNSRPSTPESRSITSRLSDNCVSIFSYSPVVGFFDNRA